MKKLLYIAPLALTLILSSCGSKDGDKKEGEKEGESAKMETGCDCMEMMVAEVKKLDDVSQMEGLEQKLNKEHPECNTLTEDMFKMGPDEAAKDCPAISELMDLMISMQPEPTSTDELLENAEEVEEAVDGE